MHSGYLHSRGSEGVRQEIAARDMPSIIHSVTAYKCRNMQAFSNLVKLATFQPPTFYQMMVSGKQVFGRPMGKSEDRLFTYYHLSFVTPFLILLG